MPKYQSGSGTHIVELCSQETDGHGLCCFVTGGELPHVGGIAVAYPAKEGCVVESISLPMHKDAVLAKLLASTICSATGQPTSVTAGLHVDNATREDIQDLCNNARAAAEMYLRECGCQFER